MLTLLERQRKVLLTLSLGEVREIIDAIAYKAEIASEYGYEEDAVRLQRLYKKLVNELEAQGVKL